MTAETSPSRIRSVPAIPRRPQVGALVRRLRTSAIGAARKGLWLESGFLVAVLVGLLLVRTALTPWQSGDYQQFLVHWFGYLRQTGLHGLGQDFANYNVPYLYLLYIGSLLTSDALVAVKTIGAISDIALALGCIALLRRLQVRRELAVVGGIAVMLLPEVLLNSAAWGQADSTYTALLVWGLWAALGDRGRTAWFLYALAFTFKLQAAFVLPAFVVLQATRRWRWQGPLVGIAAVLITEVPALVAGRSPASLASIYLDQANLKATLTMEAPSLYALLPEAQHDVLRSAGMYFALAGVALLGYLVLRAARREALTSPAVILFVAALALLAPYTLPTMHERYFYVGNVLLFVYALRIRRLLPWALVAQVVAVCAYSPFLFHTAPPLPMNLLALVEGALVFVVVRELLRVTGAAALITTGGTAEAAG